VLLHEAGAPPIHTQLNVLQDLPSNVRDRLYVVHTAAIPPDSGLRVAPTGTAGTIRLDHTPSFSSSDRGSIRQDFAEVLEKPQNRLLSNEKPNSKGGESSMDAASTSIGIETLQDGLTIIGDYSSSTTAALMKQFSVKDGQPKVPPLVFLRPTCVSDAWFILNLLSAVPFFSG
jgi:hypothetical protein